MKEETNGLWNSAAKTARILLLWDKARRGERVAVWSS